MVTATVDGQGRLVLPVHERRRLGIDAPGSEVEIIPTDEGLSIEPVRSVRLSATDDGLVVATIVGGETITNETVVETIHRYRDER